MPRRARRVPRRVPFQLPARSALAEVCRNRLRRVQTVVATGATDDEIADWIGKHAKKRPRTEVIGWNNKERDLRLSDLPAELQEYMEDYIQQVIPRNRVIYHWYDVYDIEEERL